MPASGTAARAAAAAVSDPRGYERTLRRTRELLEENDHVLELGCGTGSTALRLADGVASYLGTDFSPAMIAIAQEKLAAAPVAALSFLAATAEDPALRAGQYDAVLAFNYLGARSARHAAAHPRTAGRRRPVHLQDGVPGRHESVDPAGLAAGHARHRQGALYRRVQRLGAGAARAAAGFEILATERHADGGSDRRPYMVARKR